VDNRNPGLDMDSEPQPDGKNIQNRHLRTAWVLHRAWIRALHYRSLTIDEDAYGFEQIKHIMCLATLFLTFECDNNGFLPVEQQQTPLEFAGFGRYYEAIEQALHSIGTELSTEIRPQRSFARYSAQETIIYNIFPERLSQTFRRVGSCPPFPTIENTTKHAFV
jgi:hypothetical protein